MAQYIVMKKEGKIWTGEGGYQAQAWIETNWTNPDELANPHIPAIPVCPVEATKALERARRDFPNESYALMEITDDQATGVEGESQEAPVEVEHS